MIPFSTNFWSAERHETGPENLKADLRFPERLQPEYPGVLYWMYEGFRRWAREGLVMPEAVYQHTKGYRHDMDSTGFFVDERCMLGEHLSMPEEDLYQAYCQWVSDNRERGLDKQAFREQLIGRSAGSIARKRINEQWVMAGISITEKVNLSNIE